MMERAPTSSPLPCQDPSLPVSFAGGRGRAAALGAGGGGRHRRRRAVRDRRPAPQRGPVHRCAVPSSSSFRYSLYAGAALIRDAGAVYALAVLTCGLRSVLGYAATPYRTIPDAGRRHSATGSNRWGCCRINRAKASSSPPRPGHLLLGVGSVYEINAPGSMTAATLQQTIVAPAQVTSSWRPERAVRGSAVLPKRPRERPGAPVTADPAAPLPDGWYGVYSWRLAA